MGEQYTDSQMLDFLEELNHRADYSGRCVLRESLTGRGWRLHETSRDSASRSVREAIEKYMRFVGE